MNEHTGVVEGATLTYTYDDLGQLAGFGYPKDPGNWSTKVNLDYTYDALGRMATMDDDGTGDPLVKYRYNKASEITDATYDNGARTEYEYNSSGQVASVKNLAVDDSVMSSFAYTYNQDGLRTRVDREDAVLLYEYDTLNRLTRERKITGLKSLCLEFDGSNDFVLFGDPYNPSVDGEYELTVEAWVRTGSNVSTLQDFITKTAPFTLSITSGHFRAKIITGEDTYYCVGSTTLTTNTWYHLALVYDANAEEMRIYVNGELDGTCEAIYELYGNTGMFFGAGSSNGINANEHFFGGRLDEVRLSNIARDVENLWANGIYNKQLEVDGDTVALFHINEAGNTTIYNAGPDHYAGMLGWSGGNPKWIVEDLWANKFEYDTVGNRTKWYKYVNSSTSTFTYTYNTMNQLTYFFDANASLHKYLTYDKNGNRTRVEAKSNGYLIYDYRYWWDQDDHLIKYEKLDSSGGLLKRVEYRYCRTCAGNRTERIETDEYGEIIEWLRYEMEDLNHLRIDEMYDSPSDGNSVLDDEDPFRVQRVYYNGPGQLGQIIKSKVWDYSSQNPASTDYYYGYDILGNVSVISNSNGAEADQFEQDAFGNDVESSWSSPAGGITEHLTTKQYDADLGLYYFNARWYDSIIGVFLSYDPEWEPDNNFSRSVFCANNPMEYVDVSGLDDCPAILQFSNSGSYIALIAAWAGNADHPSDGDDYSVIHVCPASNKVTNPKGDPCKDSAHGPTPIGLHPTRSDDRGKFRKKADKTGSVDDNSGYGGYMLHYVPTQCAKDRGLGVHGGRANKPWPYHTHGCIRVKQDCFKELVKIVKDNYFVTYVEVLP